MKKYFVFLTLLCVFLILPACGANANSNDAVQADPAPVVSGSDETKPEKQEPEKPAAAGIEDISSEKGQELAEGMPSAEETNEKEQTAMKMNVQIGTYTFTATLEDNEAVRELTEMMQEGPVTIDMSDYSGFEKVGPLGRSLTTSNSQTTTAAGDIVLYNGNNIVMFYGSNSWSYTRIGKIDDLTDWTAALGSGDITAIFTLAE